MDRMKKSFFLLVLFMVACVSMASSSLSSTIVMVPPDGFQFNPQTAKSNSYQHAVKSSNFHYRAMKEFNGMVATLRKNGVRVLILKQDKALPDAVFPNNWFSTYVDNKGKTILILYPMLTPNRQKEVNPEGLKGLLQESDIIIDKTIELRSRNKREVLEGTGSLIFDKKNKLIYASISPRTTVEMVNKVAKIMHYTAVIFTSYDDKNTPIYHTNVMMGLASRYAVICLECIKDPKQQKAVIESLKKSHKEIIDITHNQVKHLCGNVIELTNTKNESLLIMSKQAYNHFSKKQRTEITRFSKILPMNLATIETVGGGSARCMIAEIFYKKKSKHRVSKDS